MAFTPTSTVRLLDVPLNNDNKNQILFRSESEQFSYFNTRIKHTFSNVTYQRKDNVMKVDAHIDSLYDSNYVMYQNSNFSQKWFYAFITKMVYVNERVTDVYIETDVFQTWLMEHTIKKSFVIREHVINDAISMNLVDEQLEYGEYKYLDYKPTNKLGDPWYILALSDTSLINNGAQIIGNIYGNTPSGLTYYPFPKNEAGIAWLKAVMQAYAEGGMPDAIVMLFSVPEFIISSVVNGSTWELGDPLETDVMYGHGIHEINKNILTVDGYTPKNKKLHTFPYKALYVSNMNGQSAVYRYEDFVNYTMQFWLFGSVMPDPKLMIVPCEYKGMEASYEHGLVLSGYPLGSWTSDQYTAWFAQNSGSIGVATAGSAITFVAGLATANPLMATGGVMSVANELAQIQKASMQPDQARGQLGSGQLQFSVNGLDFYTAHMTIKAQHAKIIDDYLTMFGYRVNNLKVPETKSRKYWNYIKTIDVNIDGNIPDNDMNKLKAIYNNGVTLWHGAVNYLNYNLSNDIGDAYSEQPYIVSASSTKDGTQVYMTFSEDMGDVTGKMDEFTVKVNGDFSLIRSIFLNEVKTKINLVLFDPIVENDVVTVTYTRGSVVSADRGILPSFTHAVTNAVPTTPILQSASTSTSGTEITLTFDQPMGDPYGKEEQFNITV